MNEISPAKYILGHSAPELQRLILQSSILRPFTERLLRNAEIGPGMRVLDLGCGPGDVTMLVAEIVGPSGSVIGIDRNADVVALASSRAEEAGLKHVTFESTSLEAFSEPGQFDCVVGRYVLVHQSDTIGFLRTAARFVRTGGVLALHELDLTDDFKSCPTVWRWNAVGNLILNAFREALPHFDCANQLIKSFSEAGLPPPHIFRESIVGGGAESPLYNWMATTLRSVWPQLVEMGLLAESEFPGETLAIRMKDAVVRAQSQIAVPAQVCAWTRISEGFRRASLS